MTTYNTYTLKNGKSIYAEVIEPTEEIKFGKTNTTLLFLHGLGSSTSFYYPLLQLANLSQYKIICSNFDGHGLSPVSNPAIPLTIERLAEDVDGLLDAMGIIGSIGLVAHSMSGLVASHFASLHPSRVHKLFLLGPVKALSPAGVSAMQDRAILARRSGLTSIANLVLASALSPQTRANSPLACALVRSLVLGTNREGYARACEALAGARNPDWNKIQAQVLVVGGATDYLCTKEIVQEFVNLIGEGSCKSIILPEVGHWIAVESPVKVAELLTEFFK